MAGLPVPLRLVVALAPRFGFVFLPLGASVSFCNMHLRSKYFRQRTCTLCSLRSINRTKATKRIVSRV